MRPTNVLLFLVLVLLVAAPASAAHTTQVQIIRYASDGTTVANQTTVDVAWMESHLPVFGDGVTPYLFQGPLTEITDYTRPGEVEPGRGQQRRQGERDDQGDVPHRPLQPRRRHADRRRHQGRRRRRLRQDLRVRQRLQPPGPAGPDGPRLVDGPRGLRLPGGHPALLRRRQLDEPVRAPRLRQPGHEGDLRREVLGLVRRQGRPAVGRPALEQVGRQGRDLPGPVHRLDGPAERLDPARHHQVLLRVRPRVGRPPRRATRTRPAASGRGCPSGGSSATSTTGTSTRTSPSTGPSPSRATPSA